MGVWVWVGEVSDSVWVGQVGWQVHTQVMLQHNGNVFGELSVFRGLDLV